MKGAPPAVILKGDERGMTALHHATWSGSGKCTKALIGHATWREGLARADTWGRTPLITAMAKVALRKGHEWQLRIHTLCQPLAALVLSLLSRS